MPPDIETASTVRVSPATVAAKAEAGGVEPPSSASPKVSVSTAPSTDAPVNAGAVSSTPVSRTTSAASTGLAPSVTRTVTS